jgi:hypothetical protein
MDRGKTKNQDDSRGESSLEKPIKTTLGEEIISRLKISEATKHEADI